MGRIPHDCRLGQANRQRPLDAGSIGIHSLDSMGKKMKFYATDGWTTEDFDRITILAEETRAIATDFDNMVNAGGGSFNPLSLMLAVEDQLRRIADDIKRIRQGYIA